MEEDQYGSLELEEQNIDSDNARKTQSLSQLIKILLNSNIDLLAALKNIKNDISFSEEESDLKIIGYIGTLIEQGKNAFKEPAFSQTTVNQIAKYLSRQFNLEDIEYFSSLLEKNLSKNHEPQQRLRQLWKKIFPNSKSSTTKRIKIILEKLIQAINSSSSPIKLALLSQLEKCHQHTGSPDDLLNRLISCFDPKQLAEITVLLELCAYDIPDGEDVFNIDLLADAIYQFRKGLADSKLGLNQEDEKIVLLAKKIRQTEVYYRKVAGRIAANHEAATLFLEQINSEEADLNWVKIYYSESFDKFLIIQERLASLRCEIEIFSIFDKFEMRLQQIERQTKTTNLLLWVNQFRGYCLQARKNLDDDLTNLKIDPLDKLKKPDLTDVETKKEAIKDLFNIYLLIINEDLSELRRLLNKIPSNRSFKPTIFYPLYFIAEIYLVGESLLVFSTFLFKEDISFYPELLEFYEHLILIKDAYLLLINLKITGNPEFEFFKSDAEPQNDGSTWESNLNEMQKNIENEISSLTFSASCRDMSLSQYEKLIAIDSAKITGKLEWINKSLFNVSQMVGVVGYEISISDSRINISRSIVNSRVFKGELALSVPVAIFSFMRYVGMLMSMKSLINAAKQSQENFLLEQTKTIEFFVSNKLPAIDVIFDKLNSNVSDIRNELMQPDAAGFKDLFGKFRKLFDLCQAIVDDTNYISLSRTLHYIECQRYIKFSNLIFNTLYMIGVVESKFIKFKDFFGFMSQPLTVEHFHKVLEKFAECRLKAVYNQDGDFQFRQQHVLDLLLWAAALEHIMQPVNILKFSADSFDFKQLQTFVRRTILATDNLEKSLLKKFFEEVLNYSRDLVTKLAHRLLFADALCFEKVVIPEQQVQSALNSRRPSDDKTISYIHALIGERTGNQGINNLKSSTFKRSRQYLLHLLQNPLHPGTENTPIYNYFYDSLKDFKFFIHLTHLIRYLGKKNDYLLLDIFSKALKDYFIDNLREPNWRLHLKWLNELLRHVKNFTSRYIINKVFALLKPENRYHFLVLVSPHHSRLDATNWQTVVYPRDFPDRQEFPGFCEVDYLFSLETQEEILEAMSQHKPANFQELRIRFSRLNSVWREHPFYTTIATFLLRGSIVLRPHLDEKNIEFVKYDELKSLFIRLMDFYDSNIEIAGLKKDELLEELKQSLKLVAIFNARIYHPSEMFDQEDLQKYSLGTFLHYCVLSKFDPIKIKKCVSNLIGLININTEPVLVTPHAGYAIKSMLNVQEIAAVKISTLQFEFGNWLWAVELLRLLDLKKQGELLAGLWDDPEAFQYKISAISFAAAFYHNIFMLDNLEVAIKNYAYRAPAKADMLAAMSEVKRQFYQQVEQLYFYKYNEGEVRQLTKFLSHMKSPLLLTEGACIDQDLYWENIFSKNEEIEVRFYQLLQFKPRLNTTILFIHLLKRANTEQSLIIIRFFLEEVPRKNFSDKKSEVETELDHQKSHAICDWVIRLFNSASQPEHEISTDAALTYYFNDLVKPQYNLDKAGYISAALLLWQQVASGKIDKYAFMKRIFFSDYKFWLGEYSKLDLDKNSKHVLFLDMINYIKSATYEWHEKYNKSDVFVCMLDSLIPKANLTTRNRFMSPTHFFSSEVRRGIINFFDCLNSDELNKLESNIAIKPWGNEIKQELNSLLEESIKLTHTSVGVRF